MKARLVGGPFDGDEGDIDYLPDVLWAVPEKGCTAWYSTWVKGAERYNRSPDDDDKVTKYLYADLNGDVPLTRLKREQVPA